MNTDIKTVTFIIYSVPQNLYKSGMIKNNALCYEIGGSFESYKVLKYPSLHLIFKIKYIFVVFTHYLVLFFIQLTESGSTFVVRNSICIIEKTMEIKLI